MLTIKDILDKYHKKLDYLDIELILSRVIEKPREFVLAHPEYQLIKKQEAKCKKMLKRRLKYEPIAYILGCKEFYGLNFKVNKHTLIPRPETELLVELAIKNILKTKNKEQKTIIDVGTGSGNIIIAIAKNLRSKNNYFGIDISQNALKIARYNAKKNEVSKKIKFLQGNLLEPIINSKSYKLKAKSYIVVANLPYLSKKIYSKTLPDIKNFEPQSALVSKHEGLSHYKKLFKQVFILNTKYKIQNTIFMEFSPEQKNPLEKMIKKYFPKAKIKFHKDLAKKWRVVKIRL